MQLLYDIGQQASVRLVKKKKYSSFSINLHPNPTDPPLLAASSSTSFATESVFLFVIPLFLGQKPASELKRSIGWSRLRNGGRKEGRK